MRRVLVTGGAGYLGSVLCSQLLDRGFAVRCVDRLLFGTTPVADFRSHPAFELRKAFFEHVLQEPELFDGVDGVIHLAGLANDPSADLDPALTEAVNFDATLELGRSAARAGVARFVFASSCSVYGAGSGLALDESSSLQPVSLYAESKVRAEEGLLALQAEGLEPVLLRQATLFGLSPRMRFDLAINLMTYHAVTTQKVHILGGGDQWRPFLHVADSADVFVRALEASSDLVAGQVFNVGSSEENYQIRALGRLVASQVPGTELSEAPADADRRSYHVSFEKLAKVLEWTPRFSAEDGVHEIARAFAHGEVPDPESARYYNVRTHQERQQVPVADGGDPLRSDFLPFSKPSIGAEEEQEVLDTLRSGWITTGPRTARFEEMLQETTGAPRVVAVSSCTAALHLALLALDIGPGDEVITSPVTWPSTANVIVHCGATPVFADTEPGTFNLDPAQVEARITPRTRAIIAVHIAGRPVDLERFQEIARRHDVEIIEDAAHALGAGYQGSPIGAHSRFTCYSFYPIKNITTGEGGAIALHREEDEEKIRMLALHGITRDAWKRYSSSGSIHWECVAPGYKYNMPDLSAALGLHQLRRLDEFIARRRQLAAAYRRLLEDVAELELPDDGASYAYDHAHHLFIVSLRVDSLRVSRDEFVTALRAENIGTGIHFRALFLQPYYRDTYSLRAEDYPVAADSSERIVSLPLYPAMTERDVTDVARSVRKLIESYRR